jgi:hypothetical protein
MNFTSWMRIQRYTEEHAGEGTYIHISTSQTNYHDRDIVTELVMPVIEPAVAKLELLT